MRTKRIILVQNMIDIIPDDSRYLFTQPLLQQKPETEEQKAQRIMGKTDNDLPPADVIYQHFYEVTESGYEWLKQQGYFLKSHLQKRNEFWEDVGYKPPQT